MPRTRSPSSQTQSLLAALASIPSDWQHGYDLMRVTGLQSGTLYPLLTRLQTQGHLEAQWVDSPLPGRPQRHAYRLTASGLALAASLDSGEPIDPRRVPS